MHGSCGWPVGDHYTRIRMHEAHLPSSTIGDCCGGRVSWNAGSFHRDRDGTSVANTPRTHRDRSALANCQIGNLAATCLLVAVMSKPFAVFRRRTS
jgi:hypothetical protein